MDTCPWWHRVTRVAGVGVALALTAAGMASAQGGNVGWLSANGPNPGGIGGRYSTLSQINVNNVRHLRVAWTYKTNVVGSEDYPLEVNGVVYAAANEDNVYALDAATGRLLWHFAPKLGAAPTWGPLGPRGLGYGAGTVYLATGDAKLYALDAATGKVKWVVPVAPTHLGYGETVAPLYYDGVIYLGSSGSDLGARGFEEALDAKTGKLIWRFYTVPSRNAPGSWVKATGNMGGGDVWETPTLDPRTGLMYVSVGNPAPDYYGVTRPGPDHWTDSVVALNMKTGKFVWGFSEVPHDLWDYDAASPPVLFPTGAGLVVGEAGKDGYWYELNAKTGELMTMPEAFVIENHVAPPTNGTKVLNWPGSTGGSEWSPVPYDPQTGYTYVSGLNAPNWMQAKPGKYAAGADDFGTVFSPGPAKDYSGTFTAFDVNSGAIAWQVHEPTPMVGGATATAGGLVFTAISGDGVVVAYDAKTGKLLWSAHTGKMISTAPSVYSLGGKEYVVYAVGGSALGKSVYGGKYTTSDAEFIAYTLGG